MLIKLKPLLSRIQTRQISNLREKLTARELPILYDDIYPTPSRLLSAVLTGFLDSSQGVTHQDALHPGFHLVHFPAPLEPSYLLPDGTDPSFSPGAPWTNRMWAGGRLQFAAAQNRTFYLQGHRAACVEKIQDVSVKGQGNNEKVFVSVERVMGDVENEHDASRLTSNGGSWNIIETRNLVFMSDSVAKAVASRERKILQPPGTPDLQRKFSSSDNTLFQFSALTYNAHKIHLDPSYAVNVEGHPGMLFHGPLSLTLMCVLLQEAGRGKRLIELEYRNLCPIYVGEEITVCCKQNNKTPKSDRWEVWVQNAAGGVAVLGRAKFFLQDNQN